MKKWFPYLLLLLAIASCKDKLVDLSGETPIKAADFIAVFPKITTGVTIADTNIGKKADTVTIGYKALAQFIPDSTLSIIYGKDQKTKIHPVGLIEKDKENYLLVNFVRNKKIRLAVFVMDKKTRYLNSKELLTNDYNDGYYHAVSINREPTFMISREKIDKDNVLQYSRTGWVYNNAGTFMVVINDSNEDPKKITVINPIDTLARKNKFSGDYVQDKKNFISLRDGKNPTTYLLFVHFEKNDGACIGELKGEMHMKSATTAQYTDNGDPCIIDFSFDGNMLSMKEQGTCGNHRGIKCYFDDTFRKKKEPRAGKKQK